MSEKQGILRAIGEKPKALACPEISVLVVALCFAVSLVIAHAAYAGIPIHPPLPDPIAGYGLNRACGAAVDSEGDIYVSNAGEARVEVFDPAGVHLESIPDSNQPCGLAVDSAGRLYASDTATGNVVRYLPSSYPFFGVPTYGAPATIDSSGEAKGIAVDPTDDSLYVAEGNRVAMYSNEGTLGVDELQRVNAPSSGTYTLSFKGRETAALPASASHAEVQAALEGLSTIGPGNVAVTQFEGEIRPTMHLVRFKGTLAGVNVEPLVCAGGCSVIPITEGESGMIAEGEVSGVTGIAAYTYNSTENFRRLKYISVAEPSADDIKIFTGRFATAEPAGFRPTTVEPRGTIDGTETPAGELGLAAAGAYLGVDRGSGHLYSYDAKHHLVDEFEADGRYFTRTVSAGFADAQPTGIAVYPQADEIQTFKLNAEGGSYTLSFDGVETAPININQEAATVRSALEGLATIGPGNVRVVRRTTDGTMEVYFAGTLVKRNLPPIVCDGTALTGGSKTCVVRTRQDGSGPEGRLYVTAGAGSGAKLLAFGGVEQPSRASFGEPRSRHSGPLCGTAVDNHGDVYVAGSGEIKVYDAEGNPIEITDGEGNKGRISDNRNPCALAVDSHGNLYVADRGRGFAGEEGVDLYKPSVYPFSVSSPPVYGAPQVVEGSESGVFPWSLAVDPVNDHLFVGHPTGIHPAVIEYASAEAGSGVLNSGFCIGVAEAPGIAVDGASGDVYVVNASEKMIDVCDSTGSKILNRIDGSGSPDGPFTDLHSTQIAVDQANGHVLVAETRVRGVVEEYDVSGAFVGEYGKFAATGSDDPGVAVDNSCLSHSPRLTEATTPRCREFDPANGNLYVGSNDADPSHFTLAAFGPVAYGEPPAPVTGMASQVASGKATLNGTVDPRGFEVTGCRFEYLSDEKYLADKESFAGAASEPCVESSGEIGHGTGAVAVHAVVAGLDPNGRYRFRLVAEDRYGPGEGAAGLFGPPVVTGVEVLPILYDEATLRGNVDPSGLTTAYRFEYGPAADEYDHSTPAQTLPGDAAPTDVRAFPTGLNEGATYHYRLVAENEDAVVDGKDLAFATQQRPTPVSCPNATLRLEDNSTRLPDCRAYEMVTPADTRGGTPRAEWHWFNEWLVTPDGPHAGESLSFYLSNTLPGTKGSGYGDGFHATRDPHGGWSSTLFTPSYAQQGSYHPHAQGADATQLYSFGEYGSETPGALPPGEYLGTPEGFEAIAKGDLGEDLNPPRNGLYRNGLHISPYGRHVVFQSAKRLEPDAAPVGTRAIYDRAAGASSANVVSVRPDGSAFGAGQDATFEGVTEDGSSVVFTAAGKLYVRHDNAETFDVAAGSLSFAGISSDGERVFYVNQLSSALGTPPGELFVFDVEAQSTSRIAGAAQFVNVSADGSHAYFLSEAEIDGEGTAGRPNLFVWDGSGTKLVATLDSADFARGEIFPYTGGLEEVRLDSWASRCVGDPFSTGGGPVMCPSRSTPDGRFLVFQSHVDLTPPYEGKGHSEIYRFDSKDGNLACVSCDPSGVPANADADLESFGSVLGTTTEATTVIPNVTGDGGEVFFQTTAALLPEDANSVLDVYEWQARGEGGCDRQGGCLSLISSGQGESSSSLYSMTLDGHDVFISTRDQLVGGDIAGSPSIYDARVNGGFPNPVSAAPCQGDTCQGAPSQPPSLSVPTTTVPGAGNETGEPVKSAAERRSLTRAQKLARALKACKRKRLRRRCEAQARKQYGAKTRKSNRRTGK